MHCGVRFAEVSAPDERSTHGYTPAHLSRKILTSRSALEGERKQVTVFFVDVKGSVALSEQVDAERWHEILDRFFEILADGVHRFEGTINQFTGDGIMALFGAPIAHEDHAERACYAALYLQRSLRKYADELRRREGLNFLVRMGLNSGEVIVGKIGDDLRMDYTAQGFTVGLAARIQELAPPNSVYLGENTAALVRGYFELEDLGVFDLKGAKGRTALFALSGTGEIRSRLELSKARGFSRFLGREDHIAELERALEAALLGEAQVVAFVGEAGLGKSRLAYEFLERCRGRGIPCAQTHAVAHGQSVPLLPVLELYRKALDVSDADTPHQAREKIAGRVVLLDPELAESLPLVFDFLGVGDPANPAPTLTPEVRQRKLIDFDVRYSIARSQREPMVTLYEDLHWMDDASLNWLGALIERAAQTRTLIIVNFRPEFLARWNASAATPARRLYPLRDVTARALMESILGGDPSLDALKKKIHSRTLGNPFFFEEVVRSLADAGTLIGTVGAYRTDDRGAEIEIPSSVQSLLAARIDQIPEWEKMLLQIVSVAGRKVSRKLLDELARPSWGDLDAGLEALREREFLVEVSLFPDAEYEFFHPLTREVAYGTQLLSRRVRTHEAVARAIENVDQDRLGERAALIAHHWTEAGRPVDSARWHFRASIWMSTQNLASTMSHLRTAREQLLVAESRSLLSDDHLRLGVRVRLGLLEIGVRLGLSRREAKQYIEEGRGLAERAGDRDRLCRLLVAYGNCCIFGADFDRGLVALREAEEVADAIGSPELRVTVILTAAWNVMARGRLKEALRQNQRALDSLENGEMPEVNAPEHTGNRAALLAMRTRILRYLGRATEAMEVADRVESLDIDADRSEWVGVVHGERAIWQAENGNLDSALVHAHRYREIAETSVNTNALIHALQSMSRAQAAREDWSEALRAGETSLEQVRDSGILNAEIGALCCIARAHLGAGARQDAIAFAQEAAALGPGRDTLHHIEALLLTSRALRQHYGTSSADKVEELLVSVADLIDESGADYFAADLHLEAGRLASLRGDADVAARELERARDAYALRGARVHADRVSAELRDRGDSG